MYKNPIFLTFLLCVTVFSNQSMAKEFPVQARLFVGSTSVDPSNVNQTIEAQGLKKIDGVTQYGLEITYPVLNYLDLGLRYTKRTVNNEEDPANAATDYSVKLDQDSMMLMARVPFVKTDIVRVDAFAGFGGSNTNLTIKTASQDGELSRKASAGWFATPYSAVGASVAVGFKWVYFVMEGGVESNKVDSFDRSGTVSSNITSIDLSGSYFMIGLLLNGIPATTK